MSVFRTVYQEILGPLLSFIIATILTISATYSYITRGQEQQVKLDDKNVFLRDTKRADELADGDHGWTYYHNIKVDTEGYVWVPGYATINKERTSSTVWVRKNGIFFTVIVPETENFKWERQTNIDPVRSYRVNDFGVGAMPHES
jgi:hypothetical protein